MPWTRHAGSLARDNARRPQLAVGLLLSASMATAFMATGLPADAREGFLPGLPESELVRLIEQGLARHPSVMLASLAALAVPVVALIAAVSRLAARWRQRGMGHQEADDRISHRSAWIEVLGQLSPPISVGEIIRIGDSDDCDLAVPGIAGGGTCALIQRTSDYEFFLFDVSAGEANLAVNGAPSATCRLYDGDRIEIGNTCLVFRTGDEVPAPVLAETV